MTSNYINNSLHLARKYARIFVRGHYLFREANSLISESEARGKLWASRKEKYLSTFLKPNWGYCVCYPSNSFRNKRDLLVRHMSTRQSLSIRFQNGVIQYSFPEFRTDFASIKRRCFGKNYNISVKGKHTFLIVWIQVADTIYKQLTVKNVNSVWSGFFGVFWYRSIDQQVYLFFCYERKPFCHPNINFNVRLESLKSVLKIGEYHWGITSGYSPVLAGEYSPTWRV